MYLIMAQYKNETPVTVDILEDKEYVFATCLDYIFSLDDNWKVWYTFNNK